MNESAYAHLVADVKAAEGLRLKAYQDSVGVWTIGYGTNLEQLTIEENLAEAWLHQKLQEAEREARGAFPWFPDLTSRQQRAIVELVYNLGLTRLRKFRRTLAALAMGDYDAARLGLLNSLWARQVGPTRSNRIADAIRDQECT